jgi:hypothetical protein
MINPQWWLALTWLWEHLQMVLTTYHKHSQTHQLPAMG